MWEVALEVRLIPLPIVGVIQEGVDVVEDVAFGDGVVVVVRPILCQRPIGDVFAAVCAILVIGVEREALRVSSKIEYPLLAVSSGSGIFFYFQWRLGKSLDFRFCLRCGEDGWKHEHPLVYHPIKIEV